MTTTTSTNAISELRSLGQPLFALVLAPGAMTKASILAAVRGARPSNGLSIKATVDVILVGRETLAALRSKAAHARVERRLGATRSASPKTHGTHGNMPRRIAGSDQGGNRASLYRLPEDPFETRLLARTTAAITQCNPMRRGAAGGSSLWVTLTCDDDAIRYRVKMERNFNTYRGHYKGWAANEDHHEITVPRRWFRLVYRRGLAVLDGLLTLDARQLPCATSGVTLYSAVWAAQCRGYGVKTTPGFIARSRGLSFHAETPEAAARGVLRKVRGHRTGSCAQSVELLVEHHGSLLLTRDDAYGIGACRAGVEAWLHRAGLASRATATLAEIAAAYRQDRAPEAIMAMRAIVKRARLEGRLRSAIESAN